MIETVRELSGWRGAAVLVRHEDEFFVVSSIVDAFDGIPETLVFASDANGSVSDFTDVAGGREMTREEAIIDLARTLAGE